MDIQNNSVTIQINATDRSGKKLRVVDTDVFVVHVFTDSPKDYLTFSKRDMLMTEWVDELTIPKHQMEQLKSGVVQYTYHYLPVAHDCVYEEDDEVEQTGAYHPHRHHGHRHEDLIHSKPVVTSIYWRNIKHPHGHEHPLNSVSLFDIERLHRLIENERIAREKDVESLQEQFGENFGEKLDAEVERSVTQDELHNSLILELQKNVAEIEKTAGSNKDNTDKEIATNATDIVNEVARATAKEIELEQLIQGEVSRAKANEEVIDTKIVMEKERAVANEANINDRLVSLTDRFDAYKELSTESLKSEVERAKATESALNDKVQNVVKDLADEVSRAAAKDIEHTNLVTTEANRAQAVENKLSTDLETEIERAKDSEKHILDEVHAVQDAVANLATATNVYTKAETDTKLTAVKNDVSSIENWIANHTDNTDELKEKVANLVADVDKAKADILQEVAKCDAENVKLAAELQTLVDAETALTAKVNKVVSDVEKVTNDLVNEATERANADLTISTQMGIVEGKVDAEVERAKASEKAISDDLADAKTKLADAKSELADEIANANANLTLEIARAKAAEKVVEDAIEIINGDNATAGSIKKALADAKDYTAAELAKATLANETALNDTLKSYATNSDVDKKISDVIGTAPEALDTLGKISNALSQDSDAISAINGVLSGKADSSAVYTKDEVDSKFTGVENEISTLETKVDNADAAISSRIDDLVVKVNNNNKTALDIFQSHNDKIDAEETARKDADKTLNDKIDAEVEKFNEKHNELNAKVIQDIADSTAKDTELEAKIDANAAALATESNRAKQVETELNDKINSINLGATNTNLSAEVDRATAAEALIQANLDAEVVRATNAEKVVSDNLADEITRAKAEEKALSDKIDAIDLSGIATLDAKIDAEVIRAKAAEKVNADAIAVLQGNVTNAESSLSTLSANLTQFVADSTAKDTEIETAISNEKSRAENAETALSDKIDILNADASTVGSIAHAVHDAEHYTDDEIAKVETAIANFKSEVEVQFATKEGVNTLLGNKADKSDVYTRNEVNDILIGYATKNYVTTIAEECARLDNVVGTKADKSAVYTKTEIDGIIEIANNKINSKLAIDSFNEWSEGVAMKSYVDTAVANVDVTDQLVNYVTNASLNEAVDTAVGNSEQFVTLSDNLEAEATRAKAAEKEITDSLEAINDIVENAINDLNSLFDTSIGEGEGGSIQIVTREELDTLFDDYYSKDEITQVLTDFVTKDELNAIDSSLSYKVNGLLQVAELSNQIHMNLNTSINELTANVYTKEAADARYMQSQTLTEEAYEALVEAGNVNENVLYIII